MALAIPHDHYTLGTPFKKSNEREINFMKKVKVEVESTLTYTPFENLGELIKQSKKDKKEDKDEKQ